MLNALIHISSNEPSIHSKEANILLNKVTDIYVSERRYKVPKFCYEKSVSGNTSTKTGTIEILSDSIESSR